MAASSLTVMVQLQDQVTAPARQATKAVDQFTNSLHRSRRGANQLGENMGKTTRSTRKFAMTGLQQAGYQVGDFAVQVGAGTSAIQAFGQQGSQLLGIFGPVGAILGAGVAIVAAVGNAFMKSAKEASDFAKATEALATATSNFDREIDLDDLEKLEEQYGELNTATIKLINSQRILAATQEKVEFAKVTKALKATATEFDVVIARQDRLTKKGVDFGRPIERVMSIFRDNLDDVAERFGLAENKLGVFGDKLRDVASSKTRDELNNNIAAALDFIEKNGGATTEAMLDLKNSLDQVAISGQALENVNVDLLTESAKKAKEQVDALEERSKSVTEAISEGFGSAFGDIVKGTKDASDAFRDMGAKIVNRLIDILVVESLVQSIAGSGPMQKFSKKIAGLATGGPVTSGQTYLVGEKGPELFTSGTNGRIIPNHQMQGGGATVVQNINISTGVSQTVRAEITQLMPQIAEASKAAVLDARKRGGSFSRAF